MIRIKTIKQKNIKTTKKQADIFQKKKQIFSFSNKIVSVPFFCHIDVEHFFYCQIHSRDVFQFYSLKQTNLNVIRLSYDYNSVIT